MHLLVPIDQSRLIGQDGEAVVCESVDRGGGLLDLGAGARDRLTHLGGDDRRQRFRGLAASR